MDSNGKTHRCRLKDKWKSHDISPFVPAAVGYVPNFYQIDKPIAIGIPLNAEGPFIENNINGPFDNSIHRYWEIFLRKETFISTNDKYKIAEIMYHFKQRNEHVRQAFKSDEMRQAVKEADAELISGTENWIFEQGSHPFFVTELEKMKDSLSKLTPDDHHKRFLLTNHYFEPSEHKKKILWTIVQGDWVVLECTSSESFITSDNVGMAFNRGNEIGFDFRNDFVFIFPVTSKYCLKITGDGRKMLDFRILNSVKYEFVTDTILKYINHRTCITCHIDVFGASKLAVQKACDDYRKNVK